MATVLTNDELLSQLRLVADEIRERAINYCDVGCGDADVAAEGHVLVGRAKEVWDGIGVEFRNHWRSLEIELAELMAQAIEPATEVAQVASSRAVKRSHKAAPTRAAVRFSREEVLETLKRLVEEKGPDGIQAGDVAWLLAPENRPLHSERIQAGLILRALANDGVVERIAPENNHTTARWTLPERSDD